MLGPQGLVDGKRDTAVSALSDAPGGRSTGRSIAVACLGAAVVTSGMQGISPAIPAIQDEFSLSAAQISLVTSVYLFPGLFSALAAGALADRIGIRPIFSGGLLIFGAGGVFLLFEHSLWVLLAIRFLQGAVFGAVLPMSVSIIGGIMPSGPLAARAQGRRIIAMSIGEAAFPVLAGLLLMVAWFAPFALQVLALPIGVLCWLFLPSARPKRVLGAKASIHAIVVAPAFLGVQLLGGLRFIFKFAVLTFFPILAVRELGMTTVAVGLALGASAVLTVVMAWFTERLAHRWTSAQLIGACMVAIVVSLLGIALGNQASLVVVALLLFGAADGIYGVAHNVLVTEMAPADVRASYVGVTGTVRNVGKFVAPLAFGAATLAFTISQSFLLLACVGVASLAIARSVVRIQRSIASDEGEAPV
jgi:ACDE family multidrug resistance protein